MSRYRKAWGQRVIVGVRQEGIMEGARKGKTYRGVVRVRKAARGRLKKEGDRERDRKRGRESQIYKSK